MRGSLLRRHALGISVAFLLAAFVAGPRWWLLTTDPSSGARVQVSPWGAGHQGSDEAEYDIVTQRAFLGELPVRDPVLTDHPQAPQGDAFWQELIGTASRPLSDIFPLIAVAVTLGSLAGFLLLYALAATLMKPWIAAAAVPIAAFLAQVYEQSEGIVALRHASVLRTVLSADPARQFHVWGRFTAPVMLLPLFFAAVIAIPRAVETGARRWAVLGAVCTAMLVYAYLFYWTALALALGLWLAWLVCTGDRVGARRLAIVGAMAVVLASPELASLARQSLSASADVQARIGVDPSIRIDTTVLARVAERLVLGAVLLWAMWRRERHAIFYVALYAAPLALVLVLGVFPQPWHFLINVWPVFALPAILGGVASVARSLLARSTVQNTRVGAVTLVVLALLATAYVAVLQGRATHQVDAAFALTTDEHAAFSWMNHHVHRGQTVVSSSITTNDLLATLTPASLYVPDGFLSHVSDAELFDRYLRMSAAYGYDEQSTFARIDPAVGGADHGPPYEQRFERFMAYYLTNWEVVTSPERIADRLPSFRAEFQSLGSSSMPLAHYPADYLYCGHRERYWPGHPTATTYVTTAFHQGEVTIYRVASGPGPNTHVFNGCGT